MKKWAITCGICLVGVCVDALAPSFIVMQPPAEELEVSRNEVKEDFGSSLHTIVKISTQVQMATAKASMFLAAVEASVADQVVALVEDASPFSTATTKKIARSQHLLQAQANELTVLLQQLEALAGRIKKTACLEEEVLG